MVPPIAALTDHANENNIVINSSLTQDQNNAMAVAAGKDVAIVFVNAYVII